MTEQPLSDAIKFELVRSVGKNGDVFLAQHHLNALRGKLNDEQIVGLYVHLRDESARLEEEWRGEFIEAFPEQESLLPEPLD